MKDYHSILEIGQNSSETDIRKAYRMLAKRYHPDINKSKNAHEKFIEISEAYEYLINHRKPFKLKYETVSTEEQNKTNYRASKEYEEFRQQARERAQQKARMRYEEFKKQHEAFQKSGFNDIGLLFKIIIRIVLLPLFFFLLLLPVYVALTNEWTMIFLFLVTWPFAGIIGWYAYDKRKNYFMPGQLYYTLARIKQIYTEVQPSEQQCYYCPYKKAGSQPYKIDLLKLKDVKLKTGGFRQHHFNYLNEKKTILIPRSRKAFIVHSLVILIKVLSILACLLFSDISSIAWRIVLGMTMGGLLSSLVLLVTQTKSSVSYQIGYSFAFRVAIWIFAITQVTSFRWVPLNIATTDYAYFVIAIIILGDSFLMQLINLTFGKYASKPIMKQYAEVEQKFDAGYKVYNDVLVISFAYPLFKWIFG